MSIAEIINENGIVTRIDYWADGKVRVVQSHGYSMKYMLKRKYGVKDEVLALTEQKEINFVKQLWERYATDSFRPDFMQICSDYMKIFEHIREQNAELPRESVISETHSRLENLCNAKYIGHKLMESKK